jgi:type I restriction enzyme S subunit
VREKTYGAALMQINIRDVRGISVWYPPLKEQAAFVARLDEAWAVTQLLAAIYQHKLAALDELKLSLLHQAFSGQL